MKDQDIYTVARRMPSNSHNACCDEDGYHWPRGLYVQDVTEREARPWVTIDGRPEQSFHERVRRDYEAEHGPSRFFQVLGYEETLILLPDTDRAAYLEPGRYCPRCDMMKDVCGCRDRFDEWADEYTAG